MLRWRSGNGEADALDGWSVRIDLVPHLTLEQLTARLAELASAAGAPLVWRELDLGLPKRLLAAVAGSVDLPSDAGLRANEMSKQARHRLAEALKGLRVPIDGTAGFDKAEVTAGGLALEALDPGTCEVRGRAGLFAFGELIDLDGPIGGLNFQAAFATAELAARAAVKN